MKRSRSQRPDPTRLVRPLVRGIHAYVPGEQPKIRGLVKLNTNENPAPPSPRVYRALKASMDPRLRLYPNPTSSALRERLARFHHCRPENVIIGNGSDELLALATRAFVEPSATGASRARATLQYFQPSYSLYPVLGRIHGARLHPVPLPADFSLPRLNGGGNGDPKGWQDDAALSFITTPHAPSGRGYATRDLDRYCRRSRGVVVLDEAYVDFSEENAMELALKHPHVLVSRTFSKSYSLCFLRVGYFIGHPDLIAALDRIRDSYNVNGLGQAAALAALEDQTYYRANFKRIKQTRRMLGEALEALGFEVLPSQANFILVKPPLHPAQSWLEALRERRILVRWFRDRGVRSYLRITIGSESECRALLRAIRMILRDFSSR